MRHNLRLIKFEAVVTFYVLGAIETLYLQSRGYTFGQIGVIHAAQVAAFMLLNIPTGYLADKTSRRMCNLVGDALTGIGIIGFALADGFVPIILAKVVISFGFSMSLGADTTLLKAVCDHLNEPFAEHLASNQSKTMVLKVVGGIGAGVVAIYHPTTAISLAALPFFLGAGVSYFIREVKAPAEPATGSIRDALRCCWSEKKIRWAILAGSTLMSAAGVIQDLAVPLAKEGGTPAFIAGGAWSYYFLAWSLGAWLYKRVAKVWEKRTLLLLPVAVVAMSLAITAIDIDNWTVFAFLLVALAHGWLAPQLSAIVTEAAPSELRATVISIYMTVIQFTFIVATLVVLNIATTGVAHAITTAFLLFVPPLLLWSWKLIRTV